MLHNPPRLRDAITAQVPIWTDKERYRQHKPTSSTRIKGRNFLKIRERGNSTQPLQKLLQELFYCTLLPVKVIAPSGASLTTYTLLDNASRGTIISKNIANSLGLKGPPQLVTVNTVVEKTSEHFQLVRFELQSATGTGEIIKVEEGLVSEKFNILERCLPEDIDNSRYPHLKDIEIPEVQVKAVSVLIGKDVELCS